MRIQSRVWRHRRRHARGALGMRVTVCVMVVPAAAAAAAAAAAFRGKCGTGMALRAQAVASIWRRWTGVLTPRLLEPRNLKP
jgi:hypothetical protein